MTFDLDLLTLGLKSVDLWPKTRTLFYQAHKIRKRAAANSDNVNERRSRRRSSRRNCRLRPENGNNCSPSLRKLHAEHYLPQTAYLVPPLTRLSFGKGRSFLPDQELIFWCEPAGSHAGSRFTYLINLYILIFYASPPLLHFSSFSSIIPIAPYSTTTVKWR